MSQHQIKEGRLLDENGNLNEAGFAFDLVKEYNRKDIKAGKGRIKEWDYYYIGDQEMAIALTIDDNSYMGLDSISILDFINKKHFTKSPMRWFTYGKTNLPSTSLTGDVKSSGKGYSMVFENNNGKRHIKCHMDNFMDKKPFDCDVELELTTPHSMVIATPFKDKPKAFYYNQKINISYQSHFLKQNFCLGI